MSFCGWPAWFAYTGGFQRGLLKEQSLKPGERTVVEDNEPFCRIGCSHAVAVAEGGRNGEIRSYGDIGANVGPAI